MSACDSICDSIKSIVFNNDYTMTVTLTDGSSYTSPVLRGATGPAGPTGPTGPAGANGAIVLVNTYPNDITLSSGSFETFANGSVVMAANQLSTDQDYVELFNSCTCLTNAASATRVLFNGNTMFIAGFAGTFGSGVIKIDTLIRLTRVNNTTVTFTMKLDFYNYLVDTAGVYGYKEHSIIKQGNATITGLNLTTTAYTFAIQANSVTPGDVQLEEKLFTYGHKS